MGVPGLSKPLKPYAISEIAGCKTTACEKHRPQSRGRSTKIIIDGPAFAYAIYHRLVIQKPDWLSALEAIPSYDEVGKGALTFLDELESYGLTIEKIYFDGYLPIRKRTTRLERLGRSLRTLSSYRSTYNEKELWKKKTWHGEPLSLSAVLQSASPTPTTFRGIPGAPFIVPVVLDAISSSKHAAVTRIVPGEAEIYCAAAVRESGGIILSNDSDLYAHDLGPNGAFVFLSSAELRANDEEASGSCAKPCKTIRLDIFRSQDIAKRLGLDNLQQLAYEYSRRHSQTLLEAVKTAKRHQGNDHEGLKTFLQEYVTKPSAVESQHFSPEALARLSTHPQLLDPRISEVICQLESKDQESAEAYLLFMIEDPSRSSAWLVSSTQRSFAYSLCALWHDQIRISKTEILQCQRRGSSYVVHEIALLSTANILSFSNTFQAQLGHFAHTFSDMPNHLIWRVYAISETYHWYLNTSRTPPSAESITRALTGHFDPRPDWDDIHLEAQIQAVLYSLRMIKQVLSYTLTAIALPHPDKSLTELATALETLPPLALLMPSPYELASQSKGLDVENILHRLALILQDETSSPKLSPVHNNSEDNTSDELPAAEGDTETEAPTRKKRKKSKKKKKEEMKVDLVAERAAARGIGRRKRDNRFEMLRFVIAGVCTEDLLDVRS